jgi:hypothetical protein
MSETFDDYVHALPWAGTTGLDWSRMPTSMELNVVGMSPEEVYQWALRTRLGAHGHLSIWYSREDGGIVVPLRDGIVALDELYAHAPGPRFSFGLDITDGIARPAFSDILQYGYGDLLVAAG